MKHNYGLDEKEDFSVSNYWKTIPYKKVKMCNVRICKNRITVNKIARWLRDWKFPELERAEATWLTAAVVEAIENNQPTADVSKMFNTQVGITGVGVIPREAITALLFATLFKKIDENDEQITIKLNWWCLL